MQKKSIIRAIARRHIVIPLQNELKDRPQPEYTPSTEPVTSTCCKMYWEKSYRIFMTIGKFFMAFLFMMR
jgi:hypothetical protein